ncbi:hypothetical protein QQS21_002971 [Conoideocrella luteorostrata]|uniref:Major facilitator superfamily (MFS) profile domain-containing protein n=1 Tax=Conoideocrella luteorostrata TaxID=1105319 RepID=A0AAJ0G0Y6_9HYPO|nr:hypothetical protein QQS21_002971 [Conoideocrella luteorostrata]
MGAAITVNQTLGWRWTVYIEAILSSAVVILSFFCLAETYGPVLLKRNAEQLHYDRMLRENVPNDEDAFRRQAQAVQLLDRVIQLSNHESGISFKIRELDTVETEILSLLTLVIQESEQLKELRCSMIATGLRSLFFLHERVFADEYSRMAEDAVQQRRAASQAALDTAANRVIDAVHDHPQDMVAHDHDAVPLCCFYSLRMALKRMDGGHRLRIHGDDHLSLLAMSRTLSQQWASG